MFRAVSFRAVPHVLPIRDRTLYVKIPCGEHKDCRVPERELLLGLLHEQTKNEKSQPIINKL